MRSLTSYVLKSCGFALLLAALAAPALAFAGSPEIDPGVLPSALTLLAGGALVLSGRRRKA